MLRKKAISATVWSAAETFMRQGLQFVISVILARLLTPEDFGTIALLYLFVGLAGVLIDSGLSVALIQRQDVTHTDECTAFWFNLGMAALMAIGLWLIAPWIASFFNSPILVPLTGLLALNLVITALGSIHGTLLTKRLDFKTPMKIGAIATSVSGALGIVMAGHGYGIWALATQTIASSVLTTSLLWTFSKWRPALTFSFESGRRLFHFGGYLFMVGILDAAYSRLYTTLIGKFYGVRDLGLYNRADGTRQLPISVLDNILSRVTFAVFSKAAQDKEKLRRGARQAIRGMMLINVPIMFGIIATAEPLLHTLFGEQWLPAAPILQVLCLSGVVIPLHVINRNVLVAQGHARLFFRLEIIKKLLGTGAVVIGSAYGVMGIAWSQVVFRLLEFVLNAHYTRTHISYGVWPQLVDFSPPLILSFVMAVIVYWLGTIFSLPLIAGLLLQVSVGAVIFLAGCHLFKLTAYHEAIGMLKELRAVGR